MITKIIWPNCRLMDGKNAFWMGCTDDEVSKNILPLLNGNQDRQIEAIKINRGSSTIKEDQEETMYCNYFLISADGTEIISHPWYIPYSGQWNASNPFRWIDIETITSVKELKQLEQEMQSRGVFKYLAK